MFSSLGAPSDVFAVGVMAWQLLTGEDPFWWDSGENNPCAFRSWACKSPGSEAKLFDEELQRRLLGCVTRGTISNSGAKFLKKLLEPRSSHRTTMQQAKDDPFFHDVREERVRVPTANAPAAYVV